MSGKNEWQHEDADIVIFIFKGHVIGRRFWSRRQPVQSTLETDPLPVLPELYFGTVLFSLPQFQRRASRNPPSSPRIMSSKSVASQSTVSLYAKLQEEEEEEEEP